MTGSVPIARVGELESGQMRVVQVGERQILLARIGDEYFAVDNRCPHMGGDLSHGKLEGTIVTCPRHGSQFDLTTGEVVRWLKGSGLQATVGKLIKSPRPLPTYRVEVDGDRILLRTEKAASAEK